MTASFNLIDKPWIAVVDTDGRQRETSILDAFRQAGELRHVVGEIPTQGFAVLRLLLAVLHRSIGGVEDVQDWLDTREDWPGTVALVEEYLEECRSRFDLRHPTTPFYQVADLHTAKGKTSGLEKLIADVPNGEQYFTTRAGPSLRRISWAETARWLVHVQAFDPAGIRSGAVGDPRVKGGKGYPIGIAWAGRIGGVFVRGATLQETLLLNLVVRSPAGLEFSVPEDVPVWEREPQSAAPEGHVNGRKPLGPVDMYTWQSRRVRLKGDDDGVTGLVLSQGDQIMSQNRHRVEPMTAWYRVKNETYLLPRKHNPSRSMWRGLAGLLAGEGPKSGIQPGVLRQIGILTAAGRLTREEVSVHAVGMAYGTNDSVVDEIVDDHLDLPTEILAHGDGQLAYLAADAVVQSERAVNALATLAENLYLAAGGDDQKSKKGVLNRTRETGYDLLESSFRGWLLTLKADSKVGERKKAWQEEVRELIHRAANELADASGPGAVVGRQVRNISGKKEHLDLGVALRRFGFSLRKNLPLAYAPADGDQKTRIEPTSPDVQGDERD